MNGTGFLDTLGNLRRLWSGLADSLRDSEKPPKVDPGLPDEDRRRVHKLMRTCLEARGGEVSARMRAAAVGQVYLTLDETGRRRFLELLAGDFEVDREALRDAALEVQAARSEEAFQLARQQLRDALVAPRQRLLSQFNALRQGVKFLIEMRADLLDWKSEDARLESLDREFQRLLATWFDVGFLELRRITWDSPAALLEKLIAYEAVHAIHSWEDLRNRLESDRRCYAFFHPAMPEEPLIFIEVALVEGLSGSIQDLLDQSAPEMDPGKADTAIFYSISNTQKGLRGISFGSFLIKWVVDDLRREFPGLKTFSTLSPIPGFMRWLTPVLAADGDDPLEERARQAVTDAAERLQVPPLIEEVTGVKGWWQDEEVAQSLQQPLIELCVRYLHQRRSNGAPIDPVERFHLGNGARIERINWLGDTSENGMRQACGLMVNYLYKLEEIEKNHERYAAEKEIVAAKRVRAILVESEEAGERRSGFGRFLPGR